MAGSNEVNQNESKVFSFLYCPELSLLVPFFFTNVLLFLKSGAYMMLWSMVLFDLYFSVVVLALGSLVLRS